MVNFADNAMRNVTTLKTITAIVYVSEITTASAVILLYKSYEPKNTDGVKHTIIIAVMTLSSFKALFHGT